MNSSPNSSANSVWENKSLHTQRKLNNPRKGEQGPQVTKVTDVAVGVCYLCATSCHSRQLVTLAGVVLTSVKALLSYS